MELCRDVSRSGSRGLISAVIALVVICVGLALAADSARAELTFCEFGSAAGQCDRPEEVAVDRETEEIFVADRANHRVNVFDVDGTFLRAFGWGVATGAAQLETCVASCRRGIAGAGEGQFSGPISVAVDNDPGSPSHHAVYVGTDNFRVQKFTPAGEFHLMFGTDVNKTKVGEGAPQGERNVCTAASGDLCGSGINGDGPGQFGRADIGLGVGPGGSVLAADWIEITNEAGQHVEDISRIEQFDSSGAFVKSMAPAEIAPKRLNSIAVDSTGAIYLATSHILPSPQLPVNRVYKCNATGTTCSVVTTGLQSGQLSVDDADNLFVAQTEPVPQAAANARVISEFSPAGVQVRRFGYGETQQSDQVRGIEAFSSAFGDVLVTEAEFSATPNRVHYLDFPAAGPLLFPGSTKVGTIGNTKATASSLVNPEGKATSYRFEFVDDVTYQADIDAEGPGHGFDHAKATPDAPVGSDFALHPVTAVIGCPNPSTEPPENCLAPSTKYHVMVVATNADNPAGVTEETEFTTLPPLDIVATWATKVGPESAVLNAEVNPLGIPTTGFFEYVDDATFQEDLAKAPNHDGFERASKAPAPSSPLDFGSGEGPKAASISVGALTPDTAYHYRVVAEDPFVTIEGPERTFSTFPARPLPPGSDPCPNAAFRTEASALLPDCRAYEMVSPVNKNGGDILPMINIDSEPAALNQSATEGGKLTYSTYRAYGDAEAAPYTSQYVATRDADAGWLSNGVSPPRGISVAPIPFLDTEFRAFSPDLCTGWLVHDTDPPLAPGAIARFANAYRADLCGSEPYVALNPPQPPIVKPEERVPGEGPGGFKPSIQGVSADGSHVLIFAPGKLTLDASRNFQAYDYSGGSLHLICRLPNGTPSPDPCSAGRPISEGLEGIRNGNVQNAISADGSKVYWSGGGSLYVRINPGEEQSPVDGAGNCTQAAKACTLKVGDGEFWAAADDGSTAIWRSSGEAKLFRYDFDSKASTVIAAGAQGVVAVNQDASRVYFLSTQGLVPGAPAGQPNLYFEEAGSLQFIGTVSAEDAALNTTGFKPSLVNEMPPKRAAQTTPDGRHLVFMSTAELTGYDNTDASSGESNFEVFGYDATAEELHCLSCNPSGSRPSGEFSKSEAAWVSARIPRAETQLHSPRVVTEDGSRIFFESLEPLVAGDSNGATDVYEWRRAASVAECREHGLGPFVPAAGGCLNLISFGEASGDSEFVDSSADGTDVFFSTAASVLPQDPGQIDIYVARLGGGFSPPPAPLPPCEGEACQNPPPPPLFETPSSSTFSGPGNVPQGGKSGCPKGKHRVTKNGKSRCVPNKKGKGKGKKGKRHQSGRAGR